MALKPTIFKLKIALSDLDRDYYDNIQLTVAQHPSETAARMMARVIAFCIHAQPDLTFTKGLSSVEEADIWKVSLDDQIECWIDVGEPAFDRVKKATRSAKQVFVYSFNSKTDVWWRQGEAKFNTLNAHFFKLNDQDIVAFAKLLERSMNLSITITGETAYIATDAGECSVTWESLKSKQ